MRNPPSRAALLSLPPPTVILSVFFFVPGLPRFRLRVTHFVPAPPRPLHHLRFVALHNYRELLANPVFWTAFLNTLYFALIGGPLTVAVSLFAALLVNSKLTRFKAAFRTIYFAPVVTTLVAVALVFKYLYHPRFGIINIALGALHLPQPDWLGDPHYAMPAHILLAVWQGFGHPVLHVLPGPRNHPRGFVQPRGRVGADEWRDARTSVWRGSGTPCGKRASWASRRGLRRGGRGDRDGTSNARP